MDTNELRLLRVFLVLMSERSVSRTAARLQLSQPATSHLLAQLRRLFGDPLLLRSKNTLAATPRALDLETQVRRLVEGFDSLVALSAAFDPATSRRTFLVTAPEYGETMLLPELIRRLRTEAPNVRVEVHAPDPDRAFDQLANGTIDMRIAWLRSPTPTLRSMLLFDDRLVCIADTKHSLIRGELTLEQFLSLPHARTLGTSHATTVRVVNEAVARLGRRLERSFLLQHFATVPAALKGTDIIATLPLRQAREFAARHPLQILEPPLPLPLVRYGVYWHERSHNDPGHRWLRRTIQRCAKEQWGGENGPATRRAAVRTAAMR